MSEYENNPLIKAIEDEKLRKRTLSLVENILAKSHMIWGFIRYPEMADHCERHTRNVFDLLTRFLVHSQRHLLEGENKLNDSELFCLIIATWLHDIGGMGGGLSDKVFLSPDKARKEHPFNGGRIVLDDGTPFLDLTDDEQSAIADIVVSHSSRIELNQLQPKMIGGNTIRTELLAVLLSLADACDTQKSRVGGFEEVKLKMHKLELLKNRLEEEIKKIERRPSPDEEKLAELRADVEYISAQKEHHYKHLSVKNVFFTPMSIILEKNVLTLPEYNKYFDMALSDVQKEFERVKGFLSKYEIGLREIRAFDERKGDVIAKLHKQVEQHEKFSEEGKIETERIGIHFFERIEEKIADRTFPTEEDFNNGLVYLDEKRQEKIEELLESEKYCLLYGAPDSGKSTFALAFGYYLFKEKGYSVFYLSKMRGGSWEDWYAEVKSNSNEKTIFVIDDCHELQEELVHFIDHIKSVKGPKFLFVSRKSVKETFEEKSLPFEIVEEKIRVDLNVFSEIIKRYCGYHQIENFEEKVGDVNEVVKNCGADLLFLKYYLNSWDPERERLSDVSRDKIYETVYKDYLESERDIFLLLSALYQFNIPIPYKFLEREGISINKLEELKERGLIFELFIPNQGLHYSLHSALFARLILDTGEYYGILSNSDEYALKILEKYLQYDSSLRIFQTLYQNEGIRIGEKLIKSKTAIEVIKDFFLTSEEINLISARLGVLKRYDIEDQNKEIILPSDTLKHFAEIIYKSPSYSIALLKELKLFYPKKIEELFEINPISETLKYLNTLNLTQIGKLINVYLRTDVYHEFREKYLLEKLKESDLKEIHEFIYDIGKNETEIRNDLVRSAVEKLNKIDLTSKLEKSNLAEIQYLIHNLNETGCDLQFMIEAIKKVNLIPKIEESSLNDINMLIYNIDHIGGDQHGPKQNSAFVIESIKQSNQDILKRKLEETTLRKINNFIVNIKRNDEESSDYIFKLIGQIDLTEKLKRSYPKDLGDFIWNISDDPLLSGKYSQIINNFNLTEKIRRSTLKDSNHLLWNLFQISKELPKIFYDERILINGLDRQKEIVGEKLCLIGIFRSANHTLTNKIIKIKSSELQSEITGLEGELKNWFEEYVDSPKRNPFKVALALKGALTVDANLVFPFISANFGTEKVISCLKEAEAKNEKSERLINGILGWVNEILKEKKEAESKAVTDLDRAENCYLEGMAYLRMEKLKEAKKSFTEAEELFFNSNNRERAFDAAYRHIYVYILEEEKGVEIDYERYFGVLEKFLERYKDLPTKDYQFHEKQIDYYKNKSKYWWCFIIS